MTTGLDDFGEYGGRKHTSFPFLAIVRYVVAAVVSLLTVVVVVMVIVVAFRSEKVTFSISHQYIQADRSWWNSTSYYGMAPATQSTGSATTSTVVNAAAAGTTTTINTSTSFGGGGSTTTTYYHYSPVKVVFFWVSLTAGNPSGRADIAGGENFTVSVFDRPSEGSFQGLREIVTYELLDRFPLNRQTSHTLEKWVRVNDTAVMAYLAKRYGGFSSFPAVVKVNKTAAEGKKPQIYYCWPVTVGTSNDDYYDNPASCCLKKEMDSPVSTAPVPAPAPAPAPALAPTAGY